MTVTLRAARPSDLPELSRLELAAMGADAWGAAALADELAGIPGTRTVQVAEAPSPAGDEAGGLVGYGVLRAVAQVAEVQRLAVDPVRRRQGIGLALLQGLLHDARMRGCSEVLLEVADGNHAAVELYVARGFGEIGRRSAYYAGGRDALVLRCPIAGEGPTVTACAT